MCVQVVFYVIQTEIICISPFMNCYIACSFGVVVRMQSAFVISPGQISFQKFKSKACKNKGIIYAWNLFIQDELNLEFCEYNLSL